MGKLDSKSTMALHEQKALGESLYCLASTFSFLWSRVDQKHLGTLSHHCARKRHFFLFSHRRTQFFVHFHYLAWHLPQSRHPVRGTYTSIVYPYALLTHLNKNGNRCCKLLRACFQPLLSWHQLPYFLMLTGFSSSSSSLLRLLFP